MRTRSRSLVAIACGALVAIGATPVDGAVFSVTTTSADGAGSLRQAILDANANPGVDTIAFDIPEPQCSAAGVCTIHLGSSPASLTDPVIVDGTTQPRFGTAPASVCATAESPSYLRVEITVPDLTNHVFQLDAGADGSPSTFRGLSLAGGRSLRISAAGSHRVYCNHFGVNGPGTAILFPEPHLWNPPTVDGVTIEGSARGVRIGTDGDGVDDIAERNVFGGMGMGVNVNANSDNVIAGNYFGLGADGTTLIGAGTGIFMRQSSAANLVGTDFDGVSDELERNVIGYCSTGVWLAERNPANAIVGNSIGVDASGAPAANIRGILLEDEGSDRVIAYNRIESNETGVAIGAGSTGTLDPDSRGNCLVGNATGFAHAGDAVIAFESNWWGTADGPSGAASGSGDAIAVSGPGTIDYVPWLTTGCPVPEPGALGAALAAFGTLGALGATRRERRSRTQPPARRARRLSKGAGPSQRPVKVPGN